MMPALRGGEVPLRSSFAQLDGGLPSDCLSAGLGLCAGAAGSDPTRLPGRQAGDPESGHSSIGTDSDPAPIPDVQPPRLMSPNQTFPWETKWAGRARKGTFGATVEPDGLNIIAGRTTIRLQPVTDFSIVGKRHAPYGNQVA